MVDWKEHGKDLLKVAGIVGSGILAYEYSSEIANYLDIISQRMGTVSLLEHTAKSSLEALSVFTKLYGLVAAAPYFAQKISKEI